MQTPVHNHYSTGFEPDEVQKIPVVMHITAVNTPLWIVVIVKCKKTAG